MKSSKTKSIFIISCIFISLLGYTKEKQSWTAKMQSFATALTDLSVDLYQTKSFLDPKRSSAIEKKIKLLSETAQDLPESHFTKNPSDSTPDADPTLAIVSGLFKLEAKRAYTEFKNGHKSYAQNILRGIPNYCITCHTRTKSGINLDQKDLSSKITSDVDRAQFFTATRQFDNALTLFEKVISDPKTAQTKQLDWERSIRSALALAVRVKQDPALTLKIINQVLESPEAALFLKEDARAWKASAEAWTKEAKASTKTEEGMFAEAKRVFAQASKLQKYPFDRSADIDFLRSSMLIHEFFKQYPKSTHQAEALFILGTTYEVLQDLELWNMHEIYYETCITRYPTDPMAKSCYQRLEQSIYVGYTGSGGTSIPMDVQAKLNRLKKKLNEKVK